MPIQTYRCRWLGLGLALALAPAAAFAEEQRNPKAVELARGVLDAMGGEEAWASTRFLRFNFFGFRLHHWDRHTGRHRLEGKSREGDSYVVLHDVNTREGTVVVGGKEASGEDKAQWLERAYGAWINDSHWLLMPYKLLDPGVNLACDGSDELDGVKANAEDGGERMLSELAVFDHLPDSVFESPAPVAAE